MAHQKNSDGKGQAFAPVFGHKSRQDANKVFGTAKPPLAEISGAKPPSTGNPGPTAAPVRKLFKPLVGERDETPTYAGAKYLGPASDLPGYNTTSPLADDLRQAAEAGDQGAHLSDVVQHGTARNDSVDLQSPQLRDLNDPRDNNRAPSPTRPAMRRQTAQSSKPGDVVVGKLPDTLGASGAPSPVDPFAK
jgi:hypothetical protein